jgi:hypothetical protein
MKIIKIIQIVSIIGMIVCFVGLYNLYHPKTTYYIQLLDYNQVEIRDAEDNLIKITTLDSVAYYLEQDNI